MNHIRIALLVGITMTMLPIFGVIDKGKIAQYTALKKQLEKFREEYHDAKNMQTSILLGGKASSDTMDAVESHVKRENRAHNAFNETYPQLEGLWSKLNPDERKEVGVLPYKLELTPEQKAEEYLKQAHEIYTGVMQKIHQGEIGGIDYAIGQLTDFLRWQVDINLLGSPKQTVHHAVDDLIYNLRQLNEEKEWSLKTRIPIDQATKTIQGLAKDLQKGPSEQHEAITRRTTDRAIGTIERALSKEKSISEQIYSIEKNLGNISIQSAADHYIKLLNELKEKVQYIRKIQEKFDILSPDFLDVIKTSPRDVEAVQNLEQQLSDLEAEIKEHNLELSVPEILTRIARMHKQLMPDAPKPVLPPPSALPKPVGIPQHEEVKMHPLPSTTHEEIVQKTPKSRTPSPQLSAIEQRATRVRQEELRQLENEISTKIGSELDTIKEEELNALTKALDIIHERQKQPPSTTSPRHRPSEKERLDRLVKHAIELATASDESLSLEQLQKHADEINAVLKEQVLSDSHRKIIQDLLSKLDSIIINKMG